MNPSKLDSGTHLAGENPVNDPKPKTNQSFNKFQRSYPHFTTARYGDVTPFYVDDAVEKDSVPLASIHSVRTPTMLSPFESELIMKKAYFDVPLRAIYPNNYDLMRIPPNNGDDIPDSNTAYLDYGFFFALNEGIRNMYASDPSVDSVIRFLLFAEKFFSRASIFDYLGYHMSNLFTFSLSRLGDSLINGNYPSFDTFFESICDTYFNSIEREYFLLMRDPVTNKVYVPLGIDSTSIHLDTSFNRVSLHWMLEKAREDYTRYSFEIVDSADSGEPTFLSGVDFSYILDGIKIRYSSDIVVNLERIVAYQLACVEYMTDNHIDSIYNTDLFRNMMFSFAYNTCRESAINVEFPQFLHNGVYMKYDTFSNSVITVLRNQLNSGYFFDYDSYLDAHKYFINLLTLRKSLRFEDYFVGGRLHPLAIGDVNVPVVNDSVSAFEMAQSQVYTRYFNCVNLSGSEFDEYSKEMLKNLPPPRPDVPKFIAKTDNRIRGYEVENTTSDNQGALVTNVRSEDERFAFSVYMDHDSILLGVVFFEARRLYSKSADRHFYATNRYDRFIPKLQYLGDQDISLAELRTGSPIDEPFAYGVRNGEYKQRVGIVSGGVVDFLKSWSMVTDVVDSYDDEDNLNSDYIRSKNVEFDRFFNSTNNSLAGWFHFIIMFHNVSEPIRPMDVAPNVLL